MATITATTSNCDNYNYEKNRLKSFQLWPCPNIVNPNELAKCGFYSTGFYMETQCNWCRTTISDWQPGDQVMLRHRAVDPFCQFMVNPNSCGNIPIVSEGTDGNNGFEEDLISSTTPNLINTNSESNNSNMESTSGEQRQFIQRELQQQDSSVQNQNVTQINFKIESNRLRTFKNWPNPNVSSQSLAEAGFYYFNKLDHVRCAWCRGVIGKWEKGDNALQEHIRFFPDCPFVQLGPLIEITNESVNLDGIRDLGIQQLCPPKATKYSCLDARMRTYASWPIPDIQNPEFLAQAGFYYQGFEDQVRCFHCNGGLRAWQKEDDAWLEHGKWFPHCNFVKLVKGPNFIIEIRNATRSQSQVVGAENGVSNIEDDGVAKNQIQTTRQNTIASVPIMTLDEAMQTEPVRRALEMGLNAGRVMNATRRQLEAFGKPFDTTEELVGIVLEGQDDEDDDGNNSEPSSSIVREVSRILNNIFNPRNQSNLVDGNVDYNYDYGYDISDFHGPGEGSSTLVPSIGSQTSLNSENLIRRVTTEQNNETARNNIITTHLPINTDENNEINSVSNSNRANCDSTLNDNPKLETNIDEETSQNKTQTKDRPPLNEQLSLEEENRKLKDARTCKVCMDDEVGVVFLPCGHLVTCVQCAQGVTVCPLCRSAIKGFVRTFLS